MGSSGEISGSHALSGSQSEEPSSHDSFKSSNTSSDSFVPSKESTTSSDESESSAIDESELEEDNQTKALREKRALCIFARDNCIRRFCIRMCSNRYFENLILLIIFANTITLAMNRYDDPANEDGWN